MSQNYNHSFPYRFIGTKIIQPRLCATFESQVIWVPDWTESLRRQKAHFYLWNAFGKSQLQCNSNSLAVTYAVLYMEFLHKNKQLTVSLWDSWSLWLPEWPVPWLEQEPAPGGRDKQTKMQLCLGEGVGEKSLLPIKQLALPSLFYICCRAHSFPPSQQY